MATSATSQLVSEQTAVILSKSLLTAFIGGVTLWYLATPYLVQPHPQFKIDFEKYLAEKNKNAENENLLENWTKWKLHIENEDEVQTLHPFGQSTLNISNKKLKTVFEWRDHYESYLYSDESRVHVEHDLPWYSRYGLYNHFYTENTAAGGVRFMPRFMFGVPQAVLEEMYGGADHIPITGMLTVSTKADRIVIQCFMNLVTLAVVFLLYINNPPKQKDKEQ